MIRLTEEQIREVEKLSDKQLGEFNAYSQKLMNWLKDEHHPNTNIILTSEVTELVEGLRCVDRTNDNFDNQMTQMTEITRSEVTKLSKEQISQFEAYSQKLMNWLRENQHPHTTIILTSKNTQLVEGLKCVNRITENDTFDT